MQHEGRTSIKSLCPGQGEPLSIYYYNYSRKSMIYLTYCTKLVIKSKKALTFLTNRTRIGYSWSILLPELEESHDTLAQESTVFNKHTRSDHHAAAPLQPHGGRTGPGTRPHGQRHPRAPCDPSTGWDCPTARSAPGRRQTRLCLRPGTRS